MALTSLGNELTQAHRQAQVELALRAAGEADVLWSELNPADPYPWALAQALLLSDRKAQSGRLAEAYLAEFSAAETGQPIRVAEPRTDLDRLVGVALGGGAHAVRNLTDAGVDESLALQQMRERFDEIVAAETQRTYREMIANTSRTQRKAWRRVTHGTPCAFCAMLASRGPVYTETTALTNAHDGLRYHKGCKCTAEPWYGRWEDWQPTAAEQPYVDAYFQAALQADAVKEMRVAPKSVRDLEGNIVGRTEDNILWRMRRNRPDLFSDGVRANAA
ncbi:hypothetical protein [Brachybacterium paraconglomeratum]|uniref:VG15 protein n=1 Tax=Brachybacterium paraconglomeratum TaxID=173362 RepID=UPI0022E1D4C9|nr:hypothetical protein [Brachybacterium paraconglomeratum]